MPLSARTKAVLLMMEFRKLYPNIRVSEAEVFLRIAENEGTCQSELLDVMKPSSVSCGAIMSRTFAKFVKGTEDGPWISLHQVTGTFGYNPKLAFLAPTGRKLVTRIEAILDR